MKLLLSNDDVFVEGGSKVTQYSWEEAQAAGEQARESGVWLNCHAQTAESVKLAVRSGFRSIYHCSYADEEAIDLLEAVKDAVFLSPAVGIMWANVHEGEEYGIDRAMAEQMGSVASLEAMTEIYPEMRRRGIRVLPGGDYGFPNNPIGRNARDLELFVDLFGYTPVEALHRRDPPRRPADGHGRRARAARPRLPGRPAGGAGQPGRGRHVLQDAGQPRVDRAGRPVPQAARAQPALPGLTVVSGVAVHG